MVEMDYDLDRMPLGKLKKTTLEKAAAVLGDLEHAISTGQGDLVELSNQFYTLVPHYFGALHMQMCGRECDRHEAAACDSRSPRGAQEG